MAWIEACKTDDIEEEDVFGFTHEGQRYAIYHSPEGEFYCTDGVCTHQKVLLARGFVMDHIIECPAHNGQFDYRTGKALREPVCEDLKCYKTKVQDGAVLIDIE